MKSTAFLSIGVATIATAAVLSTSMWGEGQSSIKKTSDNRFIPRTGAAPEGPAQFFSWSGARTAINGYNSSRRPRDAETGFDDLTNCYVQPGLYFHTLSEDNVQPLRSS